MLKRIFLIITIFFIFSSFFAFSQEEIISTNDYSGIIRFKPLATLFGLLSGAPEIIVDIIPYIKNGIGIPISIDLGYASNMVVIGVLSGVEFTPIKSLSPEGLLIDLVGGFWFIGGLTTYALKFDMGYQFISKNNFVFTPAAGIKLNGLTGFNFDLMIDIGFAYR